MHASLQIKSLAKGLFTEFKIAPKVKFKKDDRSVKLSYSGVKVPNPEEKKRLDAIVEDLGDTKLEHVEPLKKVNGHYIVKYYKGGSAANLSKDTPLDQRRQVLLGGCLGAKELRLKGLYQLDFKLENIFYSIKGDKVKAVMGDLGGLLFLPNKWNREKFIERYPNGINATYTGVKFDYLNNEVGELSRCGEVIDEGSYEQVKDLAEREICFQILIAACILFQDSDDAKVVKLIEALRSSKSLDESIKALQSSDLKEDTPPSPSSHSATTQ